MGQSSLIKEKQIETLAFHQYVKSWITDTHTHTRKISTENKYNYYKIEQKFFES